MFNKLLVNGFYLIIVFRVLVDDCKYSHLEKTVVDDLLE